MANSFISMLSFSGGVCTLERPDLARYSSSLRVMSNWIPSTYGYAKTRSAVWAQNTVSLKGVTGKIVPFNPEVGNPYVVIVGGDSLQVASVSGGTAKFKSCSGSSFSPSTPLKTKHASLNKFLWLSHPDCSPVRLALLESGNLEGSSDIFSNPPLNKDNTDDQNTIKVQSGDLKSFGGAVFLERNMGCAYNPFEDAQGRLTAGIKLSYPRKVTHLKGNLSSVETSDPMFIQGAWTFRTEGYWRAHVEIQRLLLDKPGRTWETIWSQKTLKPASSISSNYMHTSTEPQACWLRVVVSQVQAVSGSDMWTLEAADAEEFCYLAPITKTQTPGVYLASVMQPLAVPPDTGIFSQWAEYAFSERHGYPAAIAIHQSRLWFGGTRTSPQTLWASAVDRFDDFSVGVEADSAMSIDIAGVSASEIRWLQTGLALSVGTTGGEYMIMPVNDSNVLGAGNVRAQLQSAYGSSDIQGLTLGAGVAYVSPETKRMQYMTYELASDTFESSTMSDFAEGELAQGLVSATVVRSPENIWYGVRTDGTLVGMVYNRSQKVAAWHTLEYPGAVLDMTAISMPAADDLKVFLFNKDGVNYLGLESDSQTDLFADKTYPITSTLTTVPFLTPGGGMDALNRFVRGYFRGTPGTGLQIRANDDLNIFDITLDGHGSKEVNIPSKSRFDATLTVKATTPGRLNSITLVMERNTI